MRAKTTRVLLLAAWLFATGSQWDVVQAFAWARMFAQNVRVLPTLDALELTFSPDGQCGLCHLVEDSRQDGPGANSAAGKVTAKEPIVFLAGATVFLPVPPSTGWFEAEGPPPPHERARPPTPPPKQSAAA